MKKIHTPLMLVIVLLLAVTVAVSAQSEKTILTVLEEDGRFTTLLAMIERTETEQAFSEGDWTLFAPTDDAFSNLGLNAENVGSQMGLGDIADLLLYQSMGEEVRQDAAKLMLGDVTMSNGWLAGLKWYDDSLWVNDIARVIEADISASNGTIHVVNNVITPPWPRQEDMEAALMAAIEEAKLADLEEEPGEETLIEEIEESDVADEEKEPLEEIVEETVTIPDGSVLAVMAADGRFTTYLQAVGDLNLVQPYTEGNWTIFAPTDAAFAAAGLDAANISDEVSVGQLADLLLYHALDEEVAVDKAKTMLGDVVMRNGQIAGLKFFDGSLWVNDNARVVDADLRATNGIIHALNEIIERPWPRVESEEPLDTKDLPKGDTP